MNKMQELEEELKKRMGTEAAERVLRLLSGENGDKVLKALASEKGKELLEYIKNPELLHEIGISLLSIEVNFHPKGISCMISHDKVVEKAIKQTDEDFYDLINSWRQYFENRFEEMLGECADEFNKQLNNLLEKKLK